MPPRAERNPGTPKLTTADRGQIIEAVAVRINVLHEDYIKATNWRESQRYLRLVGMRGAIASPWLEPHQTEHIKKMIALEFKSLPKGNRKPPHTDEFLQETEELVGSELQHLEDFTDDYYVLSDAYKMAYEDIAFVNEQVITNPNELLLRKSVRLAEEVKKNQGQRANK